VAFVARRIGNRYEVIRELGRGGMAEVVLARDTLLDRDVAVKVLYPHLTRDEEGRRRFQREARATARLRHENIVEVHDFSGDDSDEMYLVTEYIQGRTLRDQFDDEPPDVPELGAMVVHEVLRGLEVAHEGGVIHRDIKPENVMLKCDGRVKLMDFGIARLANLESLTQADVLIGSPLYMAPEQIEEGQVDHRADLFAAGILLYFATTGVLPFEADTAPKVMRRICAGRFRPPDQVCAATCGSLARIITHAMKVDRDQRYQTALEFREALAGYLAEVGIADARTELARWFHDPKGWVQAFRSQLVPRLLEQGKKLLAARQVGPGTDCLNRVLTVQPDHPEVLDLLRQSERRARLRRSLPWAASLGLVGLVGVATATWLPDWLASRSPSRTLRWSRVGAPLLAALPAERTHPLREAVLAPEPARPRRVLETALRDVSKAVPAPTPPRTATVPPSRARDEVAVTIVPFPPAVEVQVDGRPVGKGPRLELRLPPGRHEVTLTHPSCPVCLPTSYPIEIDAKRPKSFRLAIRYEPVRLAVQGPVAGKVFVDGVLRGATNEELRVPVRGLGAQALDVVVRWSDRETKRSVTAKAGEKVAVEVR
jgi:serine/threonine-protein kinase